MDERKTCPADLQTSVNRLLLIGLLCAVAPVARADYLFTWEGNSNLFQANFQVTDTEMVPGQVYYPSNLPLSLTNSLSIASPGQSFLWGSGSVNGQKNTFELISSGPPFDFYISLAGQPPPVFSALSVNAAPDFIQEVGYLTGSSSPDILFSETGSWNIMSIPEPATEALLALGTAVYVVRRKRRRSFRSWRSC